MIRVDEKAKACDLCDGQHFEQVAQLDRHGQPLETVVCTSCGLVVHGRTPTEAQLEEFYGNNYREQYHGETTPSDRRILRAWRNGRRLYRQLAAYATPGAEVMEIGAGIGCTVKQFELAGCRASGIEPHAGFQSFGAQQLRADVSRANLYDLAVQPRYDLLLLVHVIEHFLSPRQALMRMAQLLKPGGRLYVECPNLAAPFAMRDRLFHFAHIHNFTPQTLEMLAARCGFRLERLFQSEDRPNLEMLLIRDDPRQLRHADSYARTLEAIRRHNWASYHLRWQYLQLRVRKLSGYLGDHLGAAARVRRIVSRCQATEPPERRARAA